MCSSNTQEGLEILCVIRLIQGITVTMQEVDVMLVALAGTTGTEFAAMRVVICECIHVTPALVTRVNVAVTGFQRAITVTQTVMAV